MVKTSPARPFWHGSFQCPRTAPKPISVSDTPSRNRPRGWPLAYCRCSPPSPSITPPVHHRYITVVPLQTLQRYYGDVPVRYRWGEPEVAAGAWLGPVSPKRGFAWVDKGHFRAFSAFSTRAGHSQALVSSMTPLCQLGSVWERMPGWPLGAPERAGREQVADT